MIKQKKKGNYNCKLLKRALNAETRIRILNEAHIKCCQSRDERIDDLEQSSEVQNCIIGIAVRQAADGCITFDKDEINEERKYAVIVTSNDDGTISLTRRLRKELEDAAETQQE